MKFPMLAALALVVLGSVLASAQTFGFGSAGGGLYCNYEQLSYYGGGLWGGQDNTSACGEANSTAIIGFTATVPNRGEEAYGAGVVYGDALYNLFMPGDPGDQYTVFTKLKCNKKNKSGQYVGPNGWVGIAAISGFFAGVNSGPLSCDIPGKRGAIATMGFSIGNVRKRSVSK
jgi:hypothetical protein